MPEKIPSRPRLSSAYTFQEQNAKAAEQWLASSMRVARLQQRNARFAQNWLREGAEALREQTEYNLRTAEAFARSARKQQEGLRTLQQATEQGLKTSQRSSSRERRLPSMSPGVSSCRG
jgi:hypothetical protein